MWSKLVSHWLAIKFTMFASRWLFCTPYFTREISTWCTPIKHQFAPRSMVEAKSSKRKYGPWTPRTRVGCYGHSTDFTVSSQAQVKSKTQIDFQDTSLTITSNADPTYGDEPRNRASKGWSGFGMGCQLAPKFLWSSQLNPHPNEWWSAWSISQQKDSFVPCQNRTQFS